MKDNVLWGSDKYSTDPQEYSEPVTPKHQDYVKKVVPGLTKYVCPTKLKNVHYKKKNTPISKMDFLRAEAPVSNPQEQYDGSEQYDPFSPSHTNPNHPFSSAPQAVPPPRQQTPWPQQQAPAPQQPIQQQFRGQSPGQFPGEQGRFPGPQHARLPAPGPKPAAQQPYIGPQAIPPHMVQSATGVRPVRVRILIFI